jgi:uncharacterized protein (TIGR02996 family)
LLGNIRLQPDDDLPWLVYADWLDEQSHSGAPYLRFFLRLASKPEPTCPTDDLKSEFDQLRSALDPNWHASFVELWSRRTFQAQLDKVFEFNCGSVILLITLISGSLRIGDSLSVPTITGRDSSVNVVGLETFQKAHDFVNAADGHLQVGVLITKTRGILKLFSKRQLRPESISIGGMLTLQ